MIAMQNATYVIGCYVITLGGIGFYTWRVMASARKAAREVRPEDRPWA